MPTKKLKNKSTFNEQVRAVVRQIPAGKTLSYKEVAIACQVPKAARAVARVMATNFDQTVPCHRVIHTNGQIGSYNRGGQKVKEALLRQEGCVVKHGYIST